jgi:2-C-methyl-D-erythritol 2,4-cyclodiphosphate synthase
MRIGLGYDVHAFGPGRRLVLGGVEIPNDLGLIGHSDADVLTHALMDAMLGAVRAGDIGELFPDTDPAYEGADSVELLEKVGRLVAENGWALADADCVIVCERPKLSPHRDAIRARLASALGVGIEHIGLKATTTEGLGFEGRGEGIGAYAAVLLEQV